MPRAHTPAASELWHRTLLCALHPAALRAFPPHAPWSVTPRAPALGENIGGKAQVLLQCHDPVRLDIDEWIAYTGPEMTSGFAVNQCGAVLCGAM